MPDAYGYDGVIFAVAVIVDLDMEHEAFSLKMPELDCPDACEP